jgi:hypothetical protein
MQIPPRVPQQKNLLDPLNLRMKALCPPLLYASLSKRLAKTGRQVVEL